MKYFSVSNWENSYFGGYEKVLYDHPEIRTSYNVNWKNRKGYISPLSYYNNEKLIKIFLLSINKSKEIINIFLCDHSIGEGKSFLGKKTKTLNINSSSVENALNKIIDIENELKNLFKNYEDVICNTDFWINIPDDKSDKGDIGSDNTSHKDDRNKEKAEDELSKTKKRFYVYGRSESVSGELKANTTFKVKNKNSNPTVYSQHETTRASHLVKMLDINFDPEKDKIENLKSGKLNVNKIAEVPAGNSHVYFRVEKRQTTRPFSVCILADESGSMQGSYDTHQYELMKILYKAFSEILPQDKIYIYGHSGDYDPEIRIYHDKYNQVFEYTIDNQDQGEWQQNYDGPVIESIHEKIRSFTDDNILFIVISDGEPSGENYGGDSAIKDLKRIIEKCKRDSFVTVGIGLAYNAMANIYNYHIVINDMNQLPKSVSDLLNRVVKSEFQD
jgi:hypothetical protein